MGGAWGATANAVGNYEHSPFSNRQSRDNLGGREWLIPVIELSFSLLLLRLRREGFRWSGQVRTDDSLGGSSRTRRGCTRPSNRAAARRASGPTREPIGT